MKRVIITLDNPYDPYKEPEKCKIYSDGGEDMKNLMLGLIQENKPSILIREPDAPG